MQITSNVLHKLYIAFGRDLQIHLRMYLTRSDTHRSRTIIAYATTWCKWHRFPSYQSPNTHTRFRVSYYCSSLLFYAGTPFLTPSTNTNAASTSCPIMECLHERDRQHVTHHRQRAASMGYPCKHIYLLLFYSIWFDLIWFSFLICYPFTCLYAHIVYTDSRTAKFLTSSTTSDRSYTKRRSHTPVLTSIHTPAPTHARFSNCQFSSVLGVWFFCVPFLFPFLWTRTRGMQEELRLHKKDDREHNIAIAHS